MDDGKGKGGHPEYLCGKLEVEAKAITSDASILPAGQPRSPGPLWPIFANKYL
jgi:hypothetical protein